MVYIKKLIILTGTGGRGAVSVEKTAQGVTARLNTYELPDLQSGRYVLAVISNRTRIIELGESGIMRINFSLDHDVDISSIHCAVARIHSAGIDIELYGTLSGKRMWSGEIADVIERRNGEKKVAPKAAAKINYSKRPALEDYFFDILPPQSGAYHDGMVANINYYDPASALSLPQEEELPQTDSLNVEERLDEKEKEFIQEDKKIEAVAEKAANAFIRETLPSELEREYLLKLTRGAAVIASGNAVDEPIEVKTAPKLKPKVLGLKEAAAAIPEAGSDSFRLKDAPKVKPIGFYELIKDRIDKLFNEYPRFNELESIMPETKWVKVDYDSKRYYAVGLVGSRPDFVCYAVPGTYSPTPPQELGEYCNWLPLKAGEAVGEGYWLMFQDAVSGKSVKAEQ